MAESHPFANAGLGMFGQDVGIAREMANPERKTDDKGKPLSPIAMGLGALIQAFSSKDKTPGTGAVPQGSVPAPQVDPTSAFPDVTQQQYVNPYQSGGGPNKIWGNQPSPNPVYGGMPMNPNMAMNGYIKPNPFGSTTAGQPQSTTSGYHPLTNEMWGGR
jgi:hypothetical protein